MGNACASKPTEDQMQHWDAIEAKMKAEGINEDGIAAFKYNYGVLVSGQDTMIPDSVLESCAEGIPDYDKLEISPNPDLLKQTVILKLNGGLGTGMGLDKAKSLLTVKDEFTFLDLIARQVASMKSTFDQKDLKFMLMNSFSTSADTLAALAQYPDLGTGDDLEFVQNKAPKITEADNTAASWPEAPSNEWCPPGHGDLYPAMRGSGALTKLREKGFKYMFVSNSDNLGATMDMKILTHFATSGAPFMMEVADRTDADKKGGHLAKLKEKGALVLRESAQCPEADEASFQDIKKYAYFNTNNLWIDLEKLEAKMAEGALPLPVMVNKKTVVPTDKKSTPVVQLETAMGAAISCFEGAIALRIPRSRFAPVKTTSDLLALRSDAYVRTEDFRLELAAARNGTPPNVKLDGKYKFVQDFDKFFPAGVPSLIECTKLVVEGEVEFQAGVTIVGEVKVKAGEGKKTLAAGRYENQTVEL